MKKAYIGKKIGDNQKCFFTFEAGPTHNGFESAKILIEKAAMAGADAIKFQIGNADKLFFDKNYKIKFKILNKFNKFIDKEESVYKLIKNRQLDDEEWKELKKIADKLNIIFFGTIFDLDGLYLIKDLKCKTVKIASSDINYHQLIKQVAKTGICIQIDTGNSTLKEISETIKVINNEKNYNIIIHYCPTGYPASNDGINLKYIPYLKKKFKYPVAYSDHSSSEYFSHLALYQGANMIEKTITENKFFKSIEHCMSIETKDAAKYIQSLKSTENLIKQKLYFLNNKILRSRISNRRSAYIVKKIKKGETISLNSLAFMRPGFGISPDKIKFFINKKAKKDLEAGQILQEKKLK